MKTLVLSMISIAATLAAMTACTSESDPIDETQKDQKVEIKLGAGVLNVETRAADPTDSNDKTKFAPNTQIQLFRWDIEGTTPGTLNWNEAINKTATVTASGVTLDKDQLYYANNGKNAYFLGFYPIIDGSSITYSDGKVTFTGIDGKTDILSAQLIDAGNKTTSAASANIEFKHMLSQIVVKLTGNDIAQSTFGKITSVKLKNIPKNLSLTLGDKTTAPSIAAATEDGAQDLDLYSGVGVDLSSGGETYSAMIVPELGSAGKKLSIEIQTTKYNDENGNTLTVDIDNIENGTKPGTTNNINLTFKDKITITTTIVDWNPTTDIDKDIEN
ncbi:fimbrillin family protein [Parabacteroides timonensis]|uniref:fimbrillin family protein n=1 Tax=Parabacteroides timonensis TaxID=1871013 RepID=UPI00094E8EC8|nr:fimbrillin family protein [Parabacteroides timonensis]